MFYSMFLTDWLEKECNLNANAVLIVNFLNVLKYVFIAYFKTRKNVYPIRLEEMCIL